MKKPENTRVKDLYNEEIDRLPANVSFLIIRPMVGDFNQRIEKKANNTRAYYPITFYKTISPNINLNHEPGQ